MFSANPCGQSALAAAAVQYCTVPPPLSTNMPKSNRAVSNIMHTNSSSTADNQRAAKFWVRSKSSRVVVTF